VLHSRVLQGMHPVLHSVDGIIPRTAVHIIYTLYTTATTSTAHKYSGSVRLSFWPDSASSAAAMPTAPAYRTTYAQSAPRSTGRAVRARTGNGSTSPHSRSAPAPPTTASTSAAEPSMVLLVVALHRCRPIRLPTTDAYLPSAPRRPGAPRTHHSIPDADGKDARVPEHAAPRGRLEPQRPRARGQ
jgi:hypothetical protein